MAQLRKKNGDIFEIHLQPFLNTFAYVKYINVLKYNKEAIYPDILLVYNFTSIKPLESAKEIIRRDLLINPIYIAGGNGMIRLFRRLDSENPLPTELIFPQIKRCVPDRAEEYNYPIIGWNAMSVDNKIQNSRFLDFEDVKHLDSPGLIISIDYLAFRIALEIYKKNSKNISNDFELDMLQKMILDRATEMPNFEDIPTNMRFKIQNIS
jgi:hypothetical protein